MVYDTILADIKSAMLEKNNVKRDCLRSLVSEIKNQTVNAGKELTEAIVVKCIQKSVKTHNDSIEQFEANGREELATKEREELRYLEVYLPKMMSEDEIKETIDIILQTVEATKKNFGVIMKQLPATADKKIASKYLNSILK